MAEKETKEVEYDGKTPLKGKREKYAQLLSTDTRNHTECAREAGYKDNKGLRRYAHDLAHNPNILTRSAYLRAEIAEKWNISREAQVKQYVDIRERAKKAGDHTNEIKANNSIDKLYGLSIDKTETTAPQSDLTAEQREKYAEFARWWMVRKSTHNSNKAYSSGDKEADPAEVPSITGQKRA